jgi:hypothetical protein
VRVVQRVVQQIKASGLRMQEAVADVTVKLFQPMNPPSRAERLALHKGGDRSRITGGTPEPPDPS